MFAVASTAACGGSAEHAESSTTSSGAERDGAVGARAEAGANAIDGDLGPPLDIPGVVVWLDADNGIRPLASGEPGFTWTDRSPYRHVFVSQVGNPMMLHPAFGELNGHRAVVFNGVSNRFISEEIPSPEQKEALALGGRFIVAIVFRPESEPDSHGPRYLTTARLPWIHSPARLADDQPLGVAHPTFTISVLPESGRQFQGFDAQMDVVGSYSLVPHRLILSAIGGGEIRVTLDGEALAGATSKPSGWIDSYDGEYAPIYLGQWDFDTYGFQGSVGEMVIVRGGETETEQLLDDYLRQKFSL